MQREQVIPLEPLYSASDFASILKPPLSFILSSHHYFFPFNTL